MNLRSVLGVAVLFLATSGLNAQVTGRVTGSVVDSTGAAVPDADVSLILAGSATPAFTTKTTPQGDFTILTVPANTYDLAIEAKGFKKALVGGLKVDPGRATDVPVVRLEVGAMVQTVEVSEATTSVQTSNAEVSTTIGKTQIGNLPVLNRSPLGFLQTQAGINYSYGSTTINGQRPTYVNVTVDGMNIQDNFIRTNDMDYLPNLLLLDQVAEVTVSTSNANSSSYGGSSQVAFVTPSGSNEFHGNAYWSNRNNYFAANTWFNNQSGTKIPFLNQNQLGGSLGGHVIKDKLFFYTNYEAFRLRQQSTYNTTILTDSARSGIFTYSAGGAVQKANILQLMNKSIDPTMAGILGKVPDASHINNFNLGDSSSTLKRNTAGYRYNARNNRTRDNFTFKGDYLLSPKNTFTGTFMWNRDVLDRNDAQTTFDLAPTVQNNNPVKMLTGAWRSTPASTLTNEVRFGMNIAPSIFLASQDVPKFYVAPTLITNPTNMFRTQGRNTNTYVLSDNASWVHGRHTASFGFQTQRTRIESFNDAGITPTYTLGLGGNPALTSAMLPGISATDLSAANNLLSLLAGYVASYSQTFNVQTRTSGFVPNYGNRRHLQQDNYALYGTDSWKLSRRLTLTLGLRWDYYTPVDERDALALFPVLTDNNPIATVFNPNAVLDFAGNAVGRPWYKKDLNNFAPNIGLAWDPTGEGKWAIRGGYSIAYVNDNIIRSTDNSQSTNAGLQSSVAATGVTGTVANPPAIATPTFKVPRTLADNYLLSRTGAVAFPDPGLVTPYVQQWNIGVQRTLKQALVEVRYVGNHQTKAVRGIDYNQVIINQLLPDFVKAQNNGLAAQRNGGTFDPRYNANVPGSQPIPFFSQLPNGGYLTSGTIINYIQTGQVGELAYYYQAAGINGSTNFFANPNILGGNVLTNYSNADYNALVVDVTRRFANGFQLQANYAFSRILGDAQGDQQTDFEPFLDINNAKIERSRPYAYDITHVFKANGFWELPFGKGRQFAPSNRILNKIVEGWNVAGIYTQQSGAPFGIYSGRGTLNRAARSGYNTMNTTLTKGQLDQFWSFRMTGNGPMMVPDSAKNPADGRAVAADGAAPFAGQVFFMPAAGTLGTLQRNYFSGPMVWNLDFKIGKMIRFTEKKSLEIRANAVNVFNHPDFGNPVTTPTATNFGAITGTFNPGGNSRRLWQFEAYFRF